MRVSRGVKDKIERIDLQKGGSSKRKVEDLLVVLSIPDALQIFEMAENGIRARADTHIQVGISRKQYYTRISQLVRTGLIDKIGGIYLQTRFGATVYKEYIPRLRAITDL